MGDYEKLLSYSLKLLAKRSYTCAQMRKKLEEASKKLASTALSENFVEPSNAINQVIARLMELKYLDDEQYVRNFINYRLKLKPQGKFLLTRELKNKGIAKEILDKVFAEIDQEIDINEDNLAIEALKRRYKQWQDLPILKRKQKAFNFLTARGFRADAIYKAVKHCYNQADES